MGIKTIFKITVAGVVLYSGTKILMRLQDGRSTLTEEFANIPNSMGNDLDIIVRSLKGAIEDGFNALDNISAQERSKL